MNKELYVSSTPHETRVALTEDDQLAEIFFERENEYTLAGSIYKGRVTRVLPGMQSAFVDIGLERDAFLYVSDFMEVGEDEEEFDDIPAGRGMIDLSPKEQQVTAPGPAQVEEEDDAEVEAAAEDLTPNNGNGEAEAESNAAAGKESESDEGARRWRGRRRRGGRRGRDEERPSRTEASAEPRTPEPSEKPRQESRQESRQEFGPPPGYTPIILPGESISKYRDRKQEPEPAANSQLESAAQNEDWGDEPPTLDDLAEREGESEETASAPEERQETFQHGHVATEPEQLEWAATGAHHSAIASEEQGSTQPVTTETTPASQANDDDDRDDSETVFEMAERRDFDDYEVQESSQSVVEDPLVEPHRHLATELSQPSDDAEESEPSREDFETEQTVEQLQPDAAVTHESSLPFPGHGAAPSSAPEGRTLEHETLDEEEMEFPPVPEDLEALSEVAADSDLDLVEETLDAGYGERWLPKIADVDEDEVLAAEMRGETYQVSNENEDENGADDEEEESNGRAELRAAAPTMAYQQRQSERPGYDRRGQRGRRSGRRNNVRTRPHSNRSQPLITDLLKEGQEVLVQIAKEPIAKKGARITSHIALPGRFLVYMPTVNHVGVSRKINSEEERQRLKRIVTSERENGLGGFIVRTAAANIKEEDLRADIRFLKHLWSEIKTRTETSKAPALIYHDLNLVERVLRDQVNAEFSQIWVDTEDEYERVVRFANRFQPSLVRRIKLYTKETPLFEQFGIQDEIDKSLKSKVWLKSGGYIVINQTEALVAIDINTGKYVGKTQRLEDTIVKTNVDAIKEIVRQIRLRDLGGIIVIDFIDMDERKNRQKVMAALEDALRADRAPSKVLQFNDFGLVAITRKRVKQSLERTLGESCPYCTGAGFVKSVPTMCNEIYVEMRKMIKEHDRKDVTLRVNPEVAKALKADNGKLIGEMEELIGKTVIVKGDPLLHQENFDIH
ncbi:MAG: Rne/Rng family ribonuclease [Candidatus Korobacteraceae bacterium]